MKASSGWKKLRCGCPAAAAASGASSFGGARTRRRDRSLRRRASARGRKKNDALVRGYSFRGGGRELVSVDVDGPRIFLGLILRGPRVRDVAETGRSGNMGVQGARRHARVGGRRDVVVDVAEQLVVACAKKSDTTTKTRTHSARRRPARRGQWAS